jgi:hypothetical protein
MSSHKRTRTIRATRETFPWTHFVVTATGEAHAFTVDHCEIETCNAEIEGGNAVTLHEPASKLKRLGMTELPERLDEGMLCEALGGIVVCPACFITDEPAAKAA